MIARVWEAGKQTSSLRLHLVFLWDSWVSEQVGLWFSCLLLGFFFFWWIALSRLNCFCFLIIFYFVLFDSHLLEACSYLMRNRKEINLERKGGREGLGGAEGGENKQAISYEKNWFSISKEISSNRPKPFTIILKDVFSPL